MKKVLGLGIIIILFTGMAAWARVGGGDVTFKTRGAAPVVTETHALGSESKA